MKLKAWLHSILHVGCLALLLWQGRHVQQLKTGMAEQSVREIRTKERLRTTELALASMGMQAIEACEHPERHCVIK
jgi:hypothetical protein